MEEVRVNKSLLASGALVAMVGVSACSSSRNGVGASGTVSAGIGSAGASISASGSVPSLPAVSAAGGSTSVATACQDLRKTVASIPNKLLHAATSSSPAEQLQQTLASIDQTLMSEASSAGNQLKTAVTNYIDNLKQVVSSASNGNAPDLSKLNTNQIDAACSAGGGASIGGSPPPVSATESASISAS